VVKEARAVRVDRELLKANSERYKQNNLKLKKGASI
jgi:hypothetical protein